MSALMFFSLERVDDAGQTLLAQAYDAACTELVTRHVRATPYLER